MTSWTDIECNESRSKSTAVPRLQLYNMAALSTADDLEAQKHYLQLEHGILRKFYPDEAERQEEEIERLVKCAPEHTKTFQGATFWNPYRVFFKGLRFDTP